MISGIIFDMDGVIVDTEEIHKKSRQVIFEKYGFDLKKVAQVPMQGRNTDDIFNDLYKLDPKPVDVKKLIREKRETFVSMLGTNVEPLPGVRRLLEYAKEKEWRTGLATSSCRLNVDTVMKHTGLGVYFDAMVVAEEVTINKPDPECFIKTMEKLNLKSAETIIVEDSSVGVTAGKNAGCTVVAVKNYNIEQELSHADLFVETLEAGFNDIIRLTQTL